MEELKLAKNNNNIKGSSGRPRDSLSSLIRGDFACSCTINNGHGVCLHCRHGMIKSEEVRRTHLRSNFRPLTYSEVSYNAEATPGHFSLSPTANPGRYRKLIKSECLRSSHNQSWHTQTAISVSQAENRTKRRKSASTVIFGRK